MAIKLKPRSRTSHPMLKQVKPRHSTQEGEAEADKLRRLAYHVIPKKQEMREPTGMPSRYTTLETLPG